jgi:hypothetical protein
VPAKKPPPITCKDCGSEIRPIGGNGIRKWYHVNVHEADPIMCGNCDSPLVFDPTTKSFQHWAASIDANCGSPVPRYIKFYENNDSEDLSARRFVGVEMFDLNIGRYIVRKASEIEASSLPDISPLLNLIKKSSKQ